MGRILARLRRAPPTPVPSGVDAGVVHAALKPRGLVRAGGVVVAAWWVGTGPAPEPGTAVRRRPSTDGRWLADAVLDERTT